MAMIDDFTTKAIGRETIASRDISGVETFNAATTIKAKVIYKEQLIQSVRDGVQMVSRTQIVVNNANAVSVGERITIDAVKYIVHFVNTGEMFDVVDHRKAFLV